VSSNGEMLLEFGMTRQVFLHKRAHDAETRGRGPHAHFWLPDLTKLFEQRSLKYVEAPPLRLLGA
jgi:hypothetical protein